LVHNGTIENSGVLREELEKHGIKFKSETDTEVSLDAFLYASYTNALFCFCIS
jgi:glucosamine 6-phosphate synthetase-like amidotransferase/phosphosugar isomerase protein